jgi:hypothetical protein
MEPYPVPVCIIVFPRGQGYAFTFSENLMVSNASNDTHNSFAVLDAKQFDSLLIIGSGASTVPSLPVCPTVIVAQRSSSFAHGNLNLNCAVVPLIIHTTPFCVNESSDFTAS